MASSKHAKKQIQIWQKRKDFHQVDRRIVFLLSDARHLQQVLQISMKIYLFLLFVRKQLKEVLSGTPKPWEQAQK